MFEGKKLSRGRLRQRWFNVGQDDKWASCERRRRAGKNEEVEQQSGPSVLATRGMSNRELG